MFILHSLVLSVSVCLCPLQLQPALAGLGHDALPHAHARASGEVLLTMQIGLQGLPANLLTAWTVADLMIFIQLLNYI